MLKSAVILVSILAILIFLFSKKMRASKNWQAIVTPLASIIGSGFLIIGPLLVYTTGRYALIAISVLVVLGYACGEAIRFNISNIEPLLDKNKKMPWLNHFENISKMVLGFAYVISVTFYLQLLSAFVLKGLHIKNDFYANLITTAILVLIAMIGKIRGLDMLESLEKYSVNIKLSIIGGMLAGLIYYNLEFLIQGTWQLDIANVKIDTDAYRKLFGSLIVVQGFETSRFLGSKYPAKQRIQTMRWAQLLSGCIYFLFIGLVLIAFHQNTHVSDTEIIDLSKNISLILPWALIVAAVMSQFSAAIADTVGSGGLFLESFHKKLSLKNSYLVIGALAISLTWLADIFEVINYASRAFALYYCLQALESSIFSFQKKTSRKNYILDVLIL